MDYVCGDNRFEIIERYKNELISATNIESSPDEMAVLDNILFRFWQMGWLKEQEKPNGKCVNECECWDAAYERGKQDALKEQEAVKPIRKLAYTKQGWFCGNCDNRLNRNGKYCSFCGKPILWEGR